ncbi:MULTISPECIES: C40 family peptidase [Pseudomonas]|uniref:NLP/P60 homologue n=1 Tax=Ectopseudomonas oleovorans TaxID=301 RepID=A0A653BA10_ECTOL|nr:MULTISPECIES: C40 family peptidase [Pseudomonas]QTS88364.1 C40 family peptidase [Pseudomonas khazarica]CAE6913505.1 Cell wall-associated hydrolases (invasion-associated proteins) [Pseudomonas oleovorans]
MPVTTRVALVSLALLLSACSSHAPAPQPVYIPPSASSAYQGGTEDVLFRALGLVGTPYRYGGNTPEGGFDCSGLIGYVYRDAAGISLPRSTRELSAMRTPDVRRDALQSGDLVFFATSGGRSVSHAGIYVGEGRFVHAPSSGGTVRLDSLDNVYWQRVYLDAKRVITPELAHNP